MFDELHTHLRWDTFPWTGGKSLLVLEEDKADASFVLHHLLSMVGSSRESNQLSSVLVSLEQTRGHYLALSGKLGGSMLKEGDRMRVIEVLKHVHELYLGTRGNHKERCMDFMISGDLSGLYERLEQEAGSHCLILIDKINVLQDLGVSRREVLRFVHQLQALVQRLSGTLVLVSKEESSLGKFCGHISDYILWVSHLKTGYSFSVTGNLAYRWGNQSQDHIQYLSKDKTLHVFAKGMSSAVL